MSLNETQRRTEVDLIRGIALIFIVVDHVNGSVLADYTIRNFAFFDAAEIFVFLAGYSAGAAYVAMEARHGASAAQNRLIRRSWEIYKAFVLTGVLMLVFGLLLALAKVPAPAIRSTEAPIFMAHPFSTLIEVFSVAISPQEEAMIDALVRPGHASTPGYSDPSYPLTGRPVAVSEG